MEPRRRPRVGDGHRSAIPLRQCGGRRIECRQRPTRGGARPLGGRGRVGSRDRTLGEACARRTDRLAWYLSELGDQAGALGGRRRRARAGGTRRRRDRQGAAPHHARHVAVGDGPLSGDRPHGGRDDRGRASLRRGRHRSQRAAGRGRRPGGIRVARRGHRRPPRGTCAVPGRRRPSVRDRGQPAELRALSGWPACGSRAQ